MRINESTIRQIIRQEARSALHEGEWARQGAGGGDWEAAAALEREAAHLVHQLAELYDKLQDTPHVERGLDMQDAYSEAQQGLDRGEANTVYPIVGLARAFVDAGLGDPRTITKGKKL